VTSVRPPVLEAEGLTKRFGGQLALDEVSIRIQAGEIRGLVGENGAGKSTLIKVLAGMYRPDAGRISVDGTPLTRTGPSPQLAFVHQDLGIADELTVAENIAFTVGFPRRGGLIDWSQVWELASSTYAKMDLDPPPPKLPAGRLSAADKALLGIVRAISRDARLAVLDEPTASLPAPEVAYLLAALRKLRESGTAILYVTHRLPELFAVADSVTILRSGRRVSDGPMSDYDVDSLVEHMLGRRTRERISAGTPPVPGRVVVTVEGLQPAGGQPVDFEIRHGEILGLVGLRGAGQDQIGRAMTGAVPTLAGTLHVDGAGFRPSDDLRARMAKGVVLLPADRQRESTGPGMSVQENLFPGPRNRSGSLINSSAERTAATALLNRYDVRPRRPEMPIDQLSGGNQQKVCVARLLSRPQKLVVLEEPTAGVDVGAKADIHDLVRDAAASGVAVLVVSSDLEEVAALCTRALIVRAGAVVDEATGHDLTEERLTVLAASSAPAGPPNPAPEGQS